MKLFLDLVKIDSPSGNEVEVAEFVKSFCFKRNISLTQDSFGNLYFANKNAKLLLTAHLDTVQGHTHIEPTISDGVIASQGSTILGADDKANLAGILTVVDNYYSENKEPDFELLFTVQEELGMKGSKAFDFKLLHSKHAISFDKSGEEFGTIVTQAPYGYSLSINIVGKEAHSSLPEEANNILLPFQHLLENFPLGRTDEHTTVNFGLISAGRTANTIPGFIQIKGDMRSTKKVKADELIAKLKAVCLVIEKKYKCHVDLIANSVIEGYEVDLTSKFYKKVKHAVENVLGQETKNISTNSGSDAAILMANGIETILVASGAKNCHTNNESISITDLEMISKVIKSLLYN